MAISAEVITRIVINISFTAVTWICFIPPLRPQSHIACVFPAFLQNQPKMSRDPIQTKARDPQTTLDWRETVLTATPTSGFVWRGRLKEQNTGYEVSMIVAADLNALQFISTNDNQSYNRTCLKLVDKDRYLVTQTNQSGSTTKSGQSGTTTKTSQSPSASYTCIQFVLRSPGVLQIRESTPTARVNEVQCQPESMRLDPWLFVDEASLQLAASDRSSSRHPCVLKGGFSVRIFDKTRHQGVCDGYRGETRIESDCLQGDGTYFYFRHQSCVPQNLYMYSTQKTICVTSWVEGPYTFTLLRHDRHQYMWLFRFPSLPEDSFTAYLFKDLLADSTEHISQSASYLRLDIVRDSPRPATSLCVDEYDVCSVWREPCTSGPQMALTCPRTCGICNASRPVICSLPVPLNGQWHDGAANGGGHWMTVNRSKVIIESGSFREQLRCVRWHQQPTADRVFTRFLLDEMLVVEYFNGCRPRYVCARILKKSPSVMFFKLSQTLTWPLTSSPSDSIDCSSFSFDESPATDADENNDGFRGRYFRLLFSKDQRDPVQCHLPKNLNNYNVAFRSGMECVGNLTSEAETATDFQLSLTGCPGNRTEVTFTCLESSRLLPSGDLMIITKKKSFDNNTIHCWIFPKNPQFVFFQIDSSQCNEASRGRIRQEGVRPTAIFCRTRRTKTKAGDGFECETPDGPTRMEASPGDLASILLDDNRMVLVDGQSVDRPEETKPTLKTIRSAASPKDDHSQFSPNPAVVLAVVICFAVFQCIYFCRHSY